MGDNGVDGEASVESEKENDKKLRQYQK